MYDCMLIAFLVRYSFRSKTGERVFRSSRFYGLYAQEAVDRITEFYGDEPGFRIEGVWREGLFGWEYMEGWE